LTADKAPAGPDGVAGTQVLELVAVMDRLRRECPWDRRQTHSSLAPYLLEECYEALDALERGDLAALREELGDVLLQVAFHARLAAERTDGTGWTIDDVADGIVAKLIRRHPHVFSDVAVAGADEVSVNWETIKAAERAEKAASRAAAGGVTASVLDGVALGQPALALAAQLQRRAERAGAPGALDGGEPGVSEIGAELFALVARARQAGMDPEFELRAAARAYRDQVLAWEHEQDKPETG
jgi:XTP/dITP diphosphohydrolase